MLRHWFFFLNVQSGALDGKFVNATPFRSSNPEPPSHVWEAKRGELQDPKPAKALERDESTVDYFGKRLVAQGFSYHGTEVMYSGVLGTELTCEIYMGVVYYQRLRHMVSDKFQVFSP